MFCSNWITVIHKNWALGRSFRPRYIRNTLDIVWHKVGLLERPMVIVLSLHKTWASLAGGLECLHMHVYKCNITKKYFELEHACVLITWLVYSILQSLEASSL